MSHKLCLSVLLIATAAPLGGCKKGDKGQAGPAGSASPAASTAPAKPAAQGMPVDEFASKIAPATCDWMEQCKNDKVKAVVTGAAMMIAEFGSMNKPALLKQMKPIDAAMKKDKRWLPNKQECVTIGGVALKLTGLTADVLEQKIGKTVKYDPVKAQACLASLKTRFAPCTKEVKLAKDPSLSEIDKFNKEFQDQLDAHTKACDEALTGTIAQGSACEYGFECKGEHTRCAHDPTDHKKKTCQPPRHKK